MDLPPSGWYPDPYGTPSLLRWWDGSGWTHHTHPDVTAGAPGAGGVPTATTVQGAAMEATALQGTAVQDAVRAATLQPTVQATTVQATAVQATTVQAATGQPSAEQLSRTKPPAGPPTQPQPALPVSPGAGYHSGAYQATAVRPGYSQPGTGWGPVGTADGAGTQVLALGGEPWQAPGGHGAGGVPGGSLPGNPYGYQEAQRRRRRWLIGGLTAGSVAAVAATAIIVSGLGGSASTPVADQSPTTPPASPTAAAPSATAAASASPSDSPTVTASGLVTDTQSGLSYNQLPSPWQATASCPGTLNNGAFPWTDGEYAAAGQVNGTAGPVTWYGEACSGPLPQQYYNYTGTADLQTAADSLASTFENAYYAPLAHDITPGQDTPIQVSGHAAWEVSYDVGYTNPAAQGATWTDEQAAVVVVDTGTATPAVFFVSIPSTLNESYIASIVSSLQLTAPPSSLPASGTPADGGKGGGRGGGAHP